MAINLLLWHSTSVWILIPHPPLFLELSWGFRRTRRAFWGSPYIQVRRAYVLFLFQLVSVSDPVYLTWKIELVQLLARQGSNHNRQSSFNWWFSKTSESYHSHTLNLVRSWKSFAPPLLSRIHPHAYLSLQSSQQRRNTSTGPPFEAVPHTHSPHSTHW